MKTIACTTFFVIISCGSWAQLSGTRTVCPASCDFNTLTGVGGAFEAVNAGGLNGNLILEIRGNITETGANALIQWTEIPLNSNYTLTIRPDGSTMRTLTIPAATTADLIRLNGADRVSIDGRDPGNATIDYTNRFLTFTNASTNNTVATVRFTGDASSNTIRSCIVEGRTTGASLGVVTFNATSALTSGNDNNLIEYCDIKSSTATPLNALFAVGTSAAIQNSGNIVRNNRMYDFFSATTDHHGINIANFNTSWSIIENSIYQTVNRTFTMNNRSYSAIRLDPTASGIGFLIQNNFIGGTAPECGGATWQLTAGGSGWARGRIIFINSLGTTSTSTISGNIIKKITANQRQSASAGEGLVVGILVANGNADVNGNIIGDATGGLSSIAANNGNVGSAHTIGISYTGAAFGDITNNNIDNLVTNTLSTNPASAASSVIGISINKSSGSQSFLLERNTVGSRDGVLRITTNNNATGLNINASGITVTSSTLSQFNIRRNYINNLTSNASGTSSFSRGISYSGNTTGGLDVLRNSIQNIVSSANNSATTGAAAGLYINNPATNLTVRQNFIFNIHNPNAVNVYGIALDNLGGNATVSNNMITLGEATTTDTKYVGLINLTTVGGPVNWYFNSVLINGPGNAGNTQNTFGFYRTAGITTPTELRNNILINTRAGAGKHYAIGSESATTFSSDFNSLFATVSANMSRWVGVDYDFANWQIQTVGDANSLNYDATPDFQDVTIGNLRIFYDGAPKVLEDAGAAAGGITIDIDGARRLGLAPDIGATELYNGWTGVVSTDWNTPGNWSYIVPTCADVFSTQIKVLETDVIPGPFQPSIGAFTASFVGMVIGNDATLNLATNTSVLAQCPGAASPDILLVEGDVIFSDGVTPSQAEIQLLGDLENNGTIDYGIGTFTFNSTVDQFIRGVSETTFYNLTLQGGGDKELEQNIFVENNLDLVSGVLVSSATEMITLNEDATTTSASNASFIDGPLAKKYDDVISFESPVGKAGVLRPVSIATVNTSPTTFTSEYFPVSAIVTFPGSVNPPLDHVSDREYWTITRNGLANATVTLTWDANSYVDATAGSPGRDDLLVAGYDGLAWNSEGGNAIAGSQAAGSVTSDVMTSFNQVTFGSSSLSNPLPVLLLYFKAEEVNGHVKLTWKTASELNNDFFTIESSTGEIFREILRILGNGTTNDEHSYTAWDDSPYPGRSYYKLSQRDFDGMTESLSIVSVTVENAAEVLRIYPNPVTQSEVTFSLQSFEKNSRVKLVIHNASGGLMREISANTDEAGTANVTVPHYLTNGLYIVRAVSGLKTVSQKLIVSR